jgi:hypothetical protein
MENLFGIEMAMLTLGVFILCYTFINIIANVVLIAECIKNGSSWRWEVLPHTVMLTVGIMLIIIAVNL